MFKAIMKFLIKLVLICLVHFVWAFLFLMFALGVDSFSDIETAVCFFMTEPLASATLWPFFAYKLIKLIIKKDPCESKAVNVILWTISIILSLLIIGYNILFYIENIIEYGFSLFLYADYWLPW